MTAFGWVPRARVCPCARCVEAKTSPSSSARQTPTATASWPIATCRKPGSSPARKSSSTFSSKTRTRSMSRYISRASSCEISPRFSTFATGTECTLQIVTLVAQWRQIEAELPEDWGDARLVLTVDDENHASQAAALLGPLNPGRSGKQIRLDTPRRGAGLGRLLRGLDEEGIVGRLELVSTERAEPAAASISRESPAAAWDAALAGLPEDWSDLYVELELASTDYLEPAALRLAPVNPARYGEKPGFRFRCARRFGYGASPGMVRRCLERLDEAGIVGDKGKDIFDGLAVSSGLLAKARYVPAESVGTIVEGRVEVDLGPDAAERLEPYDEPPPSEEILPVSASRWERLRGWFRR